MNANKLNLPEIVVPFKWLVATITIACSAFLAAASALIWVGSMTTKVEAHNKEISELRGVVPKVARIEGILEYAFPREAAKVPKE